MIVLGAIIAGFVLGLLVRWWGLVPAIAAGVWLWSATHVDEVPPWSLGLMAAAVIAFGVVLGVLFRYLWAKSKPNPAGL